jgi:hypothetical protein
MHHIASSIGFVQHLNNYKQQQQHTFKQLVNMAAD